MGDWRKKKKKKSAHKGKMRRGAASEAAKWEKRLLIPIETVGKNKNLVCKKGFVQIKALSENQVGQSGKDPKGSTPEGEGSGGEKWDGNAPGSNPPNTASGGENSASSPIQRRKKKLGGKPRARLTRDNSEIQETKDWRKIIIRNQ